MKTIANATTGNLDSQPRRALALGSSLCWLAVGLFACGAANEGEEAAPLGSQGFALEASPRASAIESPLATVATGTISIRTGARAERTRSEAAAPPGLELTEVAVPASPVIESTTRVPQDAVVTHTGEKDAPLDLGALPKAIGDDFKKNMCWLSSYGRGVGSVPSECGSEEKDGLLCYPQCAPGYHGVGPVCWIDNYGRGVGTVWPCNDDEEYDTGLCYTRCQEGFHGVGPVCWGNGDSISYTRGAGSTMSCGAGLEYDAGLCYSPCSNNFDGIGPVCWGSCPAEFPIECGAACAKDTATCAKGTAAQATSSFNVILKLIEQDWGGAVSSALTAANTYNLPICK